MPSLPKATGCGTNDDYCRWFLRSIDISEEVFDEQKCSRKIYIDRSSELLHTNIGNRNLLVFENAVANFIRSIERRNTHEDIGGSKLLTCFLVKVLDFRFVCGIRFNRVHEFRRGK